MSQPHALEIHAQACIATQRVNSILVGVALIQLTEKDGLKGESRRLRERRLSIGTADFLKALQILDVQHFGPTDSEVLDLIMLATTLEELRLLQASHVSVSLDNPRAAAIINGSVIDRRLQPLAIQVHNHLIRMAGWEVRSLDPILEPKLMKAQESCSKSAYDQSMAMLTKNPSMTPTEIMPEALKNALERVRPLGSPRNWEGDSRWPSRIPIDEAKSLRRRIDPPLQYSVTPVDDFDAMIDQLNASGETAKFKQVAALKVPHGHDRFSRMSINELTVLVPLEQQRQIVSAWAIQAGKNLEAVEDDRESLAKCMRWILRGLNPAAAVRKVLVDAEIGLNAASSKKSPSGYSGAIQELF